MYHQTQTSTGTVLTQVHQVQGQQHQGLVNGQPQLIQIQPVALHPQQQQQSIQVQYQPIATTQVSFQPIQQVQNTQTNVTALKGKKKVSKKSKSKKQLVQQQQQIVAAQYQQVQQQHVQQQHIQQQQQQQQPAATVMLAANPTNQTAMANRSASFINNIMATKTEIKEEPKVLAVATTDMEDYEYGANSEGELNAGCRKCNVVFGTAVELKVHFGAAHNRQTFECFVCNKLFLQKFSFLAHVERYHSDLGNSFPCQHCDKSYTNQKALELHVGEYHKHLNLGLMCPICQKTFPQKFSLRRHVQNVHENAGTADECKHPFKCQTCGKSYKSQSGLTIHSKSKHQNTQYKCDLCHKTFSRASNVARHVDTIHNLSKTFPCKWCGKEFRSTGGRDMHVTAEHKAVRYNCEICGKVFKRKGSLSRHMAGTHGEGYLQMFKCDVCSKMFKQKSHLKTHLKNLHNIITPSFKELEAQRLAAAAAAAAGPATVAIASTALTPAGQRTMVTQVQPNLIINGLQAQVLQPATVGQNHAQFAQQIFMK